MGSIDILRWGGICIQIVLIQEGDWKEDKHHGKGIYWYCDDSKYEGDFANDE